MPIRANRRYEKTYCHYCQQHPIVDRFNGCCSAECLAKRRQKDYDRYHRTCIICHIEKKRPGSSYCSDKCQRIAEDSPNRHVKRNPTVFAQMISVARCPVCGERISATKDCKCPTENY